MVDIIVKINGGLGNQLFQLATGYALIKKTGFKLKIDNSIFLKQNLRSFNLNYLNLPLVIASKAECLSLGAPLNLYNKLYLKLFKKKSGYYKENQSFVYDKSIEQIKNSTYLDGYWQNLNYFEEYRDDLIKLFSPDISFGNHYDNYLRIINATESVSIHVRRGDYVENPENIAFNVCGLEYYKLAINFIEQNIIDPIFFIFSDDIDWCKKNFVFLENVYFIDKTSSLLEDYQLIRNCKSHINPNSTFSWWSAWLNINESGFKYCTLPRYWKNDLKTEDLNIMTEKMIII